MVSEKEIEDRLIDQFKDLKIEIAKEHRINVYATTENLIDIANFIKHDLGFSHPNMCTGIDTKENIEVLWHIGHPDSPILIILRASTDREKSEMPNLTNIWRGFNWHERETYDLVGVNFIDHPDLRRLIMPENWEGHPLREDYIYRKPQYRKMEDN